MLFQLNILVSSSRRACLADFGLATTMESKPRVQLRTGGLTGTLRWQAPELLADIDSGAESTERCNTFATDVYAFASVCFEVTHLHV